MKYLMVRKWFWACFAKQCEKIMKESEKIVDTSPPDESGRGEAIVDNDVHQNDLSQSRQGKVTLSTVAAMAGVSLATASKALNNQPRVSERTRTVVRSAAEQLSYHPNTQARSLISGRTQTIGVITADLTGRFSMPILIGAEDELGVLSNTLLLCNARGDARIERHHLNILLSRNVDGLLVVGKETTPRNPVSGAGDIPTVYVYAPSKDSSDCSVISDNVGAGHMAVAHLLSCGRRRIAIIGGGTQRDGSEASSNAARERLHGAREALSEAGLKPCGPVRFGSWSESWGRAGTRLLLDQGVVFDSVVCQSDEIARGCLDVLKERGIEVPSEVAVIGHDNRDTLAPDASPPLTSIDNSTERIGRLAAKLLLDAINGHPHHGIELVPCKLVLRDSTLQLG